MDWVSNVCHLLFNCSSSSTPPLSSLSDFVPSVLPSMDVAFIPNFGSRSTEITEVVDCYVLTPPLILDMGLEVGGSWSDWKHQKLGNENGRGTRLVIEGNGNTVSVDDIVDKVTSMGFRRDLGGRMAAINLESRAALLAAEQMIRRWCLWRIFRLMIT
ncbi:unnamed protein product [Lactuca saligna]|uniref:Uncharacterized protein n=1 Tax=Lactuca saligna TaxID=75948 RepID=A0AA35ZWK6_LACSI|nr:unnamed protein product [Lactuca saligna]